MRRLLSASFRNRLFAAFLAASLIPLLLCSALLLQIFRLRMEDRAQGEALAVEISCAIGEAMAPYTDGLYLMTPFNRISLMETIMERLG